MGRGNGESPLSLRDLNRRRVVDALRLRGAASRADLARETGLSRATISSLVSEMLAEGLVVDMPDAERDGTGAGRPPSLIGLGKPAGAAVGVDFGRTHLAVAVSDLAHNVLAEARRVMPAPYDVDTGGEAAAALVAEMLEEAGVRRDEVIGVGLGVPGPIHRDTGEVGSGAILPGWAGMRLEEGMADRLELPVHVDNDANLGALAEQFWGAGEGAGSLLYIKVATGIGSGLVLGGRVFAGAGGTAGEIGHLTVDEHGPICRCGNRGCLESFAAGPAILELLSPSLGDGLTIEDVVERAHDGDAGCRRAIADAGRHLGNAVAGVCNVLNPERVVVGGSLGQARELLLDEMRDAVDRRALRTAAEDLQIVSGVLGERAEVLGGVALIVSDRDHPDRAHATPATKT